MSHQPVDVDEHNQQIIGESAGNKIIELDPNEEHLGESIPKDVDPEGFTHGHLSHLCDQLQQVDADGQAARVEIERKHMVDNPGHVLRFTAKELTSIVISLATAYTANRYNWDQEANKPIKRFGYLIGRQEDAPKDGTHRSIDIPNMAPYPDLDEEIRPFKVIKDEQQLVFLDGDGEILQPEDLN